MCWVPPQRPPPAAVCNCDSTTVRHSWSRSAHSRYRLSQYRMWLIDPHKFWRRKSRRWILRTCLGKVLISWMPCSVWDMLCSLCDIVTSVPTDLWAQYHVKMQGTQPHMCTRYTLNQLQRAIHAGISVAQQMRIEWEPFYNHIPHAVCNCAVWLVRRCRCTTSMLKMTPTFTPGLTFCGLHFLRDCARQLHAIMMHLCNEHSMSHALVCLTMWLLGAFHAVPRHALQGSLVCHTRQYRSCAEFSKTATPLAPAESAPRSKQLARRYNNMSGSHCMSASVSVHDIHATSAQVQETTTDTQGCRTQGLCRKRRIITCILSCIIASAGLTGENGWFWSEGMHISKADPRLLTRVLTSEDHPQCQNCNGSAADANTFVPDYQSATHCTCTSMQEWTTSHVDQRLQPSQCSFLIASVHTSVTPASRVEGRSACVYSTPRSSVYAATVCKCVSQAWRGTRSIQDGVREDNPPSTPLRQALSLTVKYRFATTYTVHQIAAPTRRYFLSLFLVAGTLYMGAKLCIPHPRKQQASSLGPKSEGGRQITSIHHLGHPFLVRLCILLVCIWPASGVRVAADPTPAAGVNVRLGPSRLSQMVTKPGGNFDTSTQPVLTHARKRAYKRAVRRAQRDGSTVYRGRRLTLQQLNGISHSSRTEQSDSGTRRSHRRHVQAQSHIGVLSWNVGGLSNAILDEILLWLSLPANQGIRVVFLQETRWKFTSEWENDKWCLVHSGHTKQKGAGILTLISKELCAPADVRVRVLASGRALHVRVPLAKCGTSLDLLNVYQHAWDQRADMAQLTVKRAYVLAQVDACIQQLPWRNLCVCAGDMNAQLAPLPGLVGNSTKCTEIQRQSAPDAMSLQDMVIARQLVALNTWSGPRRHSFTYENQGRHTQIDYVFARRHQVTPCVRNCRPIPDFPITAWRQTGLRRPLVVSVDYVWRPAQLQAGRRIDTDAMARAHMQQSPLIASFGRDVQRAIQEVAPEDPASLHQILYDSSLKHFPAQPVRKQYAYQHEEVERAVQSRWLHLNQGKFYRQTATTCLASAWKCWYHFARFRAMRRDANQASRQARKQRYDRLLLEAESDTAQHCVHRLYAVIRQMAPKQPFRRVMMLAPAHL